MKKLLLVLAILLPSCVFADNVSLSQRLVLLDSVDVTVAEEGLYIATPAGISRYFIKVSATEDSAGSFTPRVFTTEAKAPAGEVAVHAFSAISATGPTRVLDSATSGQLELGPYIQVDTTTFTGTWDITIELWYSQVPVR